LISLDIGQGHQLAALVQVKRVVGVLQAAGLALEVAGQEPEHGGVASSMCSRSAISTGAATIRSDGRE
jgi:hypothetical protein